MAATQHDSDGPYHIHPGPDAVLCTAATRAHWPHIRLLAQSLMEHAPDQLLYVLALDDVADPNIPAISSIRIVTLETLSVEPPPLFTFRYTLEELPIAAQPHFIRYLLESVRAQQVIYVAPQTLVMQPLDVFWGLLQEQPITLARMSAPTASRIWDQSAIQTDQVSLGFLAMRAAPPTLDFLTAWQTQTTQVWRRAGEQSIGMFRRWLDDFATTSTSVTVIEDATVCVMTHTKKVDALTLSRGHLRYDGKEVVLAQFTDVVTAPLSPAAQSPAPTPLQMMQTWYRVRLAAHVSADTPPPAAATFDNGVPIPDAARWCYRALGEEGIQFDDPARTDTVPDFFTWLSTAPASDAHPTRSLPRLWQWLHQHDEQVRRRFPDVWDTDYDRFCWWILREGAEAYSISDRFAAPLRRQMLAQDHEADHRNRAQRVDNSLLVGVNLAGHFSSEKGVGEAARSAVRIFDACAIPYVLNNFVDPGSANSDTTFVEYRESNPYPVNLITLGAGEVPWFASQQRDDYFRDHYTIGHWAWELADFPREWLPSFRYFDEVWVASSYVRDALATIAPVPVITVPYTITGELPPESAHDLHFGLPHNAFVFLTVFDFNSYAERKNPLAVIRAFTRAFSPHESVFLLVKCVHSQVDPDAMRALQTAAQRANIRVMDGVLPRRQLQRLFGIADCHVSLHRAEGFGLTIAEAMSIGKPVIATGYSGNMEFMRPTNSFACDYRLVPLTETHGPYQRGFVWAEPDLDHAATLMRYVYEHPEIAHTVGEQARRDMLAHFTPAAIGHQVRARLEMTETVKKH